MARITVPLQPNERDALFTLAEHERRNPRDQAALIIRDWLIANRYLPADPQIQLPPARAEVVSRERVAA